jgi:hypothetical protein
VTTFFIVLCAVVAGLWIYHHPRVLARFVLSLLGVALIIGIPLVFMPESTVGRWVFGICYVGLGAFITEGVKRARSGRTNRGRPEA